MIKRIFPRLLSFGYRCQRRVSVRTGSGKIAVAGGLPPMKTSQLLLILHQCREQQEADLNRWPQFLFGKNLEEIDEGEAAQLIRHLNIGGSG